MADPTEFYNVFDHPHRNRSRDETSQSLQFGGGGGTYGGMDAVDAKIAASEARTDTKFAELRGDLRQFPTKGTVWAAAVSLAATILGVLAAFIAFGGDRFDAGISLADQRQTQISRDREQDAAVRQLDKKLDAIIERLPAKR